ncbi:MAG: sulfur carrier protein ThiS [Pirellulaceae bacterium]|nr:sulfur carrier protein ThiS [Planctomycetales bacterium]MCA9205275.1 sulfur carrier protein ThiS [Planctomycetales bacterium]MCA9222670.1 sulfur carrier protein ThiS [Planctomycetales bacterium]
MKIQLNGEPREIPDGATVAELLALLELRPEHVAVEVNEQLAPRARHGEITLNPGDELELVTLVGGG